MRGGSKKFKKGGPVNLPSNGGFSIEGRIKPVRNALTTKLRNEKILLPTFTLFHNTWFFNEVHFEIFHYLD